MPWDNWHVKMLICCRIEKLVSQYAKIHLLANRAKSTSTMNKQWLYLNVAITEREEIATK